MTLRLGDTLIAGSGANTDLSNLSSQGKNIAKWSNNVTNCITEIPQDIKITLSADKKSAYVEAGTKMYYPDGFEQDGTTKKFTAITLTVQKVIGLNSNLFPGIFPIVFRYNQNDGGNFWANLSINNCVSGSSLPANGYEWYDTTNNREGFVTSGTLGDYDRSTFPLGILIVDSSGVITDVQTFNGFGYIGSTVFALPGVKGLIPNGRNADGTLKSTEFTTSRVLTASLTGTSTNVEIFVGAVNLNLSTTWKYYEDVNLNKQPSGGVAIRCSAGTFDMSSNIISNFTPKTAFHAVDYNDSSTISGWAMPSSRYINLTLGASGASYTAPANGWIFLSKDGAANTQIRLANLTTGVQIRTCTSFATALSCFIPVKRGDVFQAIYNAAGNTNVFRFVYAEGEN